MSDYLVFTNTRGQRTARSLDEARKIAEMVSQNAPEWDQPRIYEWLAGCAGLDCTCGGQIHPRSVLITD